MDSRGEASAERDEPDPPAAFVDDRIDLEAAVGGDVAAFDALYQRHVHVVYRHAYSLLGSRREAEEVAQDVFVTLWSKLPSVRIVDRSLLPWLLVTCRHGASNLRRRNALRAHAPLEDADGAPLDDSMLDRLVQVEELDWVLRAVGELTPTDRRIVELCLFEGRDYRDAAAQLGLSVGAITKRIHRTRTRLREQRSLNEREAST